jgi:hypothetical protein
VVRIINVAVAQTAAAQVTTVGVWVSEAQREERFRPDQSSGYVPLPSVKPYAFVKLRRREVSNCVVLGDTEKRNIVATHFEAISKYLMDQGCGRFRACAIELEEVLQSLMTKWKAHKEERPLEMIPVSAPPPHDDQEDGARQHAPRENFARLED